MNLNTCIPVTCIFKVEIFKADGSICDATAQFRNRVLDSGLLFMYTKSLRSLMSYINIGNGTTSITDEDIGLASRKFSTNVLFNSTQYATVSRIEGYRGYLKVFQFAIGTCTGDFTEVGLSAANNADYFNRQFFKDADGNQIIVRVKADEGLRITAEVRVYKDPAIKMFSKILLLNLYGATAGTLTLTNGTTDKTITFSRLDNLTYTYQDINSLLTGSPLLCLEGSMTDGYYMYFNPLLETDINLYIKSHTLTGGSADPEMYIIQPFTNKSHIHKTFKYTKDGMISDKDVTICCAIGRNKLVNFYSLTQIYPDCTNWLYSGYLNSDVFDYAINTLAVGFIFDNAQTRIMTASEIERITTPELKNNSVTIRTYLYPYTQYTYNRYSERFILGFGISSAYNSINSMTEQIPSYIAILKEPLPLQPREEFEILFSISWGRYEDYIEGVV